MRACLHLVRSSSDLDPLRHRLQCRGAISDVARGYADELLVDVEADGALWLLGSQASEWTLQDSRTRASSRDASDAFEELLRTLIGRRVESLDVTAQLDLVCKLDGDGLLVFQAKGARASDGPPHWEVFTPDGEVISAGPGEYWESAPADVPIRDLPGARHRPQAATRATSSLRVALAGRRAELVLAATGLVVGIASFLLDQLGAGLATSVALMTTLLVNALFRSPSSIVETADVALPGETPATGEGDVKSERATG
jgi:hypothetical protein